MPLLLGVLLLIVLLILIIKRTNQKRNPTSISFSIDNRKYVLYGNLGKHGNLCNQLFQIACCFALAKETNRIFVFDRPWRFANRFPNVQKQVPVLSSVPDSLYHCPREDGPFEYCPIPDCSETVLCVNGYRQNAKYFDSIRKHVLELFWFPDVLEKPKDKTCFHVRLGDYRLPWNASKFLVCDKSYYQKAWDLLDDKPQNVTCFSDQPKKAKNLLPDSINMIRESPFKDDPVSDLFFMSRFPQKILSNSSFSWWSCYLYDNQSYQKQVVIAPWPWLWNDKSLGTYQTNWTLIRMKRRSWFSL